MASCVAQADNRVDIRMPFLFSTRVTLLSCTTSCTNLPTEFCEQFIHRVIPRLVDNNGAVTEIVHFINKNFALGTNPIDTKSIISQLNTLI